MMVQSPAAFGLYPSTKALYFGTEALRAARFRQTDISVVYSDGSRALQMRESDEDTGVADPETESLAGVLSSLSGIGMMMAADGPFMAAGPIHTSLVSSGGLVSSLRELGVSERDVARVEGRLKEGSLLLSVQCEDHEWIERARQILQETGAEHVSAT